MEYLMTYGWAILIIAVVLGVLFQLGIFSSTSLVGNSCIASPGFQCQNMVLGATGTLSFTFGQATGATMYNIALACDAVSGSTGLPSVSTAWNFISGGTGYPSGTATSQTVPNLANAISLVSSETVAVTGMPCYTATGTTTSTLNVGSSFTGSVWVNWTSGTACTTWAQCASGSSGNPSGWQTAKILTINTKVV